MKPGRLQNALKSFGRASKCFKILWPGLINPENSLKIREFSRNPRGIPRIFEKTRENSRTPLFFREFPWIFENFYDCCGQRAKPPQKTYFFRQHKHGSFGGPHRGAAATAPGSGPPVRSASNPCYGMNPPRPPNNSGTIGAGLECQMLGC